MELNIYAHLGKYVVYRQALFPEILFFLILQTFFLIWYFDIFDIFDIKAAH